ncbi:hypothetical protein [Mucilaginibacter sp.]|jgi:hypothetical protein|uniref:hypothetical protein n=1 Tax=Mucilaginibacter sp. TaxID=1882438 RepID=UPI002C090E2E|nr:hypothetical protein [Mucilaginibacter sp.]HTI59970.1 hypothetical protein [Mucilaginibacter sp.]
MKKICLLAFLSVPFIQLKAQDAVVFKLRYLPNHVYNMSVMMGMKISANVSGDQSFIDKLNSEGITQPVKANFQIGMTDKMATGPAGTDKMMPLTADFRLDSIFADIGGKQPPIPPNIAGKNIKMFGRASQENLSVLIDSVAGKKTSDSSQMKMRQMMGLVQKQIKFPEKALKPGDSFTQSTPMNIPITRDNSIKIDAAITYKLVSISDGKAYFDLIPNLDINLNLPKATVNITGSGSGKLVYSIKDDFPLSRDVNFKMVVKVTSEKVNVDGTADIVMSSHTEIN